MKTKIIPLILILLFCIPTVSALKIENIQTVEYEDKISIHITVSEPSVDVQILHDSESIEYGHFSDRKIRLLIPKKEDIGQHTIRICIRKHNGTEEIEYTVYYRIHTDGNIVAGDVENPPNPYVSDEKYGEAETMTVAVCGLWVLIFLFTMTSYSLGSREKTDATSIYVEHIPKEKVIEKCKEKVKTKEKVNENRCSYCGTKTGNEKRCSYCGGKV